jgi:hypothetical protein
MGRPIVYCQGCGKSLREEEFDRGRAYTIDNRPFCIECRPAPAARKASSQRIPIPPLTPRRAMHVAAPVKPPSKSAAAWAAAGGALLAVAVLAVVFSTGGRKTEPPSPQAPRAPAADRGAAAIAELEKLTEVEAVLARCDLLRSQLRGTPHEARLRTIEERALEERRTSADRGRENAAKLDRFLVQIRELIGSRDPGERKDEIERMLKSAEGMAGTRRAEVDALRSEFQKRLAAPAPVEFLLAPDAAKRTGTNVGNSKSDGGRLLGGFNGPDRSAQWTIDAPRAGAYRVELTYAVAPKAGGEFTLTAGKSQLKGKTSDTGGWEKLRTAEFGTLELPQGPSTIVLKPVKTSGGLLNLRQIRLRLP